MITVKEDECRGCGVCVDKAPKGAITIENGVAVIHQEHCLNEDDCVKACPFGVIIKNEVEEQDNTEEAVMHRMKEYAESKPFKLNPDKEMLNGVIKGLVMNKQNKGEYYCPCRMTTGNKEEDKKIICPCIYHEEEIERDGHCHCWLFVKD